MLQTIEARTINSYEELREVRMYSFVNINGNIELKSREIIAAKELGMLKMQNRQLLFVRIDDAEVGPKELREQVNRGDTTDDGIYTFFKKDGYIFEHIYKEKFGLTPAKKTAYLIEAIRSKDLLGHASKCLELITQYGKQNFKKLNQNQLNKK